MKRFVARVGLILLLATGQTMAQTPADTPADKQDTGTTEPASTAPGAAAEAAPTADAGAAAPAPGEPDASDDPFDYEASEQISEDLSVSFPVDI